VVQPDLVVICDKSKLTDEGCLGAPDLVVEIISPYTSKKDIKEKFELYEREGVREYWIVYPGDRAVQVFSLTDEGYFDEGRIFDLTRRRVGAAQASEAAEPSGAAVKSVLFPDLSVPLVELFAE
jgi:Uma2 family endonuclease